MVDNTNRLIAEYFNGRLEVNIKATKLKMAYEQSEDDTQLKEYEFQKSTIEELIHDLPPIQLKALTIHEKEQCSWQDVSEKLGVKSSSLVYWKSKFIKRLRSHLSEYEAGQRSCPPTQSQIRTRLLDNKVAEVSATSFRSRQY